MNTQLNTNITIFTPTYNREETLIRLYKSLCKQTKKNFIWLIVDDGSTDNTNDLVKNFINEKLLNIKYFYQDNSGKMMAHNLAVKNCDTEYFFCVDSDDYLPDYCVESIYRNIRKIDNINDIAGLIGYKCISNSMKDVVSEFPDVKISTIQDLYWKGFKGETSLVFKTKVLQKYDFPKIENEKFITEAYLYDQIDMEYTFYLLRDILTIYEYQTDGLTTNINNIILKNPKGFTLFWGQRYKFQLKTKKIKKALISGINYIEFSKNSDFIFNDFSFLEKSLLKVLLPFGLIKYHILVRRLRKESRNDV